jgi:hypothetical protein
LTDLGTLTATGFKIRIGLHRLRGLLNHFRLGLRDLSIREALHPRT